MLVNMLGHLACVQCLIKWCYTMIDRIAVTKTVYQCGMEVYWPPKLDTEDC